MGHPCGMMMDLMAIVNLLMNGMILVLMKGVDVVSM
jgi:hypothetical protein